MSASLGRQDLIIGLMTAAAEAEAAAGFPYMTGRPLERDSSVLVLSVVFRLITVFFWGGGVNPQTCFPYELAAHSQ